LLQPGLQLLPSWNWAVLETSQNGARGRFEPLRPRAQWQLGRWPAVADIDEGVRPSAEWISERLQSLGYAVDFSPQSLREIDRFFDDTFNAGVPRRRFHRKFVVELVDPYGRSWRFAIVAYVGEVIRQAIGGEWVTDDCRSVDMIDMQLVLPSGRAVMPMIEVVRSLTAPKEASLADFGIDCGLAIEP
jgi:hypothetical protein